MEYWSGLVISTLRERIKEVEDALERKSPFFAILKGRGNVEYNHSGRGHEWRVRVARIPVDPYHDGSDITASRHDLWDYAYLDYRAYNAQASLSKLDKLANKGTPQLIDLFAQQEDELEDAFVYTLPTQILTIDGHAAANADRIHGLESWFGYGAAMADNRRLTPTDNYARLSTVMGAVGGGIAETQDEYLVWTPTIYDATGTGWSNAVKTWAANATEIIREGISAVQATNEIGRACDLVLMTQGSWRSLLAQLDAKEQLTVERGNEPYVSKPGFQRVFLDTVEIIWDVHMPANTVFGLTMGDLVLMSMQPTLFAADSDFAWQNKSWRWSLDFYGTLKTKTPRTHFKVINAD